MKKDPIAAAITLAGTRLRVWLFIFLHVVFAFAVTQPDKPGFFFIISVPFFYLLPLNAVIRKLRDEQIIKIDPTNYLLDGFYVCLIILGVLCLLFLKPKYDHRQAYREQWRIEMNNYESIAKGILSPTWSKVIQVFKSTQKCPSLLDLGSLPSNTHYLISDDQSYCVLGIDFFDNPPKVLNDEMNDRENGPDAQSSFCLMYHSHQHGHALGVVSCSLITSGSSLPVSISRNNPDGSSSRDELTKFGYARAAN